MWKRQTDFDPRKGDALIVVDVQNDFLPGGALAVPDGDAVVPVLNRYLTLFSARGLPIIATRDWHPADHCSFTEQGGIWPPHCVSETGGAAFAGNLELPEGSIVISKANVADQEAYSGFQGTGLDQWLREHEIRRLFVGGLATDYCVLETVKDALRHGCEVILLTDAVRAVDVQPGDGDKALTEMQTQGAVTADYEQLAA